MISWLMEKKIWCWINEVIHCFVLTLSGTKNPLVCDEGAGPESGAFFCAVDDADTVTLTHAGI